MLFMRLYLSPLSLSLSRSLSLSLTLPSLCPSLARLLVLSLVPSLSLAPSLTLDREGEDVERGGGSVGDVDRQRERMWEREDVEKDGGRECGRW